LAEYEAAKAVTVNAAIRSTLRNVNLKIFFIPISFILLFGTLVPVKIFSLL